MLQAGDSQKVGATTQRHLESWCIKKSCIRMNFCRKAEKIKTCKVPSHLMLNENFRSGKQLFSIHALTFQSMEGIHPTFVLALLFLPLQLCWISIMLQSDISLASAFLQPSHSSRKEITDKGENYQQGLIPPVLSMGMSSVENHSIWL